MVVYSLGMTFYWCVDYHLPQNQVASSLSSSISHSNSFLILIFLILICFPCCPCSRSIWVLRWRVCFLACVRTWWWEGQTSWRCWRPVSFTTRPRCCLLSNVSWGIWLKMSTETQWVCSERLVVDWFGLVTWSHVWFWTVSSTYSALLELDNDSFAGWSRVDGWKWIPANRPQSDGQGQITQ